MTTGSAPLWRILVALLAATLAACGGGGGGNGGGNRGPLTITTTTANDGMIGRDYNLSLAVAGGTGTRAFSVRAGALPTGLSLSAAGVITGEPAGPAGTANFTVTVTDSAATPVTDNQTLAIKIVEPLVITTAAIADPVIGEAYADALQAAGGTPPYSFSTEGGLPSGLSLSTDGSITGTPADDATSGQFSASVMDSSSMPFSGGQNYRFSIDMDIVTTALADGTGGVAYSDALQVQGGLPPYHWTQTASTLPNGLSLGPTGIVSGTPVPVCTPVSGSIDVKVADNDFPAQVQSRAGLALTVNPAPLAISSASLPAAIVGVAYSHRVPTTGGVPPYSFAITGGTLPSGLALNASNGRIAGTPDTAGTQAFQLTVTDACPNTAARNFDIIVNAAAVGRNDSIADATTLPGNGTYAASISPSGDPVTVFDPDEDYYRIHTNATSTVTIDINAQVNGSPLDAVIEVLNSGGTVLNQCGSPTFNAECISDDEDPGISLDSLLQVRVNGATTFYIHVADWSMIARPDMLYDLVISGVN